MILGVGIDLLNISRVQKLYTRFKNRFSDRILSKDELKLFVEINNIDQKINFLAKKFSAKESFSKAIGTGIGRGVNFIDISVLSDSLGKPIMYLSNDAMYTLESLFRKHFDDIKIDLSITDEDNYVNTIVVLSSKR